MGERMTCDGCGLTGEPGAEEYVTDRGAFCRRCVDRLDRAEMAAEAVFTVLPGDREAVVTGATRRILGAWSKADDERERWLAEERRQYAERKAAGCRFVPDCRCGACG